MIIYTITAVGKVYGEKTVIFSSASKAERDSAASSLGRSKDFDFYSDDENHDDYPACGMPLIAHGEASEMETLEMCVERDYTGDF